MVNLLFTAINCLSIIHFSQLFLTNISFVAPGSVDHSFHRAAQDEAGAGKASGRFCRGRRRPPPENASHQGRLLPRRREGKGVSLLETQGLETEPCGGQRSLLSFDTLSGPTPTLSAIPHRTRWRHRHSADCKSHWTGNLLTCCWSSLLHTLPSTLSLTASAFLPKDIQKCGHCCLRSG